MRPTTIRRRAAQAAEADLARDANDFVDELKKGLGSKPDAAAKPEPSAGQRMDKTRFPTASFGTSTACRYHAMPL